MATGYDPITGQKITNGAASVSPLHQGGEENVTDANASLVRTTGDWNYNYVTTVGSDVEITPNACRLLKIITQGATAQVTLKDNNSTFFDVSGYAVGSVIDFGGIRVDGGTTSGLEILLTGAGAEALVIWREREVV